MAKNFWVALDGASAVRQVNLPTGTAGLQFPTPADASFEGPGLVASMAAIPGQPNPVAVMTYFSSDGPNDILLAIYDSGVPRPMTVSYVGYDPFPWAMVVNAATSSYGQAINPENATVLGTFYPSGTTAAQGSIAVDTTLGKASFLEDVTTNFTIGTGFSTYQIGAFNLSNYTATSDTPIQIAAPESRANYQYQGPTGPRLTRWGSDGLAFHGTGGFISFRSNFVQNLSTTNADLAVVLTPSGAAATGNTTIYRAIVTNNGLSAASSVDAHSVPPVDWHPGLCYLVFRQMRSAGTCLL